MFDLNGFQIKLATTEESAQVITLLKSVASWLKENEIKQWGYLLEGGDDEEIEQAIANNETYLVVKEGELVGTFTLLAGQSEWDKHVWGTEASTNVIYLHRLAILPTYMKRGLGKSLINWILNNQYDKEYIRLDCVLENSRLNHFYKENGFELVGTEDGHAKYQKKIKIEASSV
jgi:GNAT superfamily N-acetyltransferase